MPSPRRQWCGATSAAEEGSSATELVLTWDVCTAPGGDAECLRPHSVEWPATAAAETVVSSFALELGAANVQRAMLRRSGREGRAKW
jgi:hypothetical protein